MNDNDTICYCFGVKVQDIKNAIEEGATTFEEVQEITSAGKGCGGCANKVKALVEELKK